MCGRLFTIWQRDVKNLQGASTIWMTVPISERELLGTKDPAWPDPECHQRQNDYRYRSEIKSKTIGL